MKDKSKILLQKIESVRETELENVVIKVDLGDNTLIKHTLKLDNYGKKVIEDMIKKGDIDFFYSLKDFSNSLENMIAKKSKKYIWEELEKKSQQNNQNNYFEEEDED